MAGMAYHVDREVVLSLGGRLTEIGTQGITLQDGSSLPLDMILQEVPKDKPPEEDGRQVILISKNDNPFDKNQLAAALVETLELEDAIRVQKSQPDRKRNQKIIVDFKMPASISWDGLEHDIHLEYEVKVPKIGRKNFDSFLPSLLGLVNGRPAQHYQNKAAAVIYLQEMIFAKRKSVTLILDKGKFEERVVNPDRFFGKELAMLLTQTAGGFFERRLYQDLTQEEVSLHQKPDSEEIIPLLNQSSFEKNADGKVMRVTDVSYAASLYQTRYQEDEVDIGDGKKAYELKEIQFLSGDGLTELMAIVFNTGDGRGIRDLGYESLQEQEGRFKFRIEGQDGFAYGDFVVSKTEERAQDSNGFPIYYTSIVLMPKYSKDMKNKKIIIHVVHSRDGVYTETQVVPITLVHPPVFELN